LDLPQSSPVGRESRELDLPQSSPVGRESRELDFAKAEDRKAVGFTQLYPIFSSVSMERMLLLNDLFIDPEYRGQGIGKALIDTAKDLCRTTRQKGIVLQTETNNPAQRLYEREGFTKDPDLHYFWKSNA
ncbi:MAG: GNAT family N-acetyltransferase, partial [Dokdonia sp.]